MKSGEPNSYCRYCFDLPELMGGKDTPIFLDLLHGLEDVLSLYVTTGNSIFAECHALPSAKYRALGKEALCRAPLSAK
jgi:hypothetical protein